MIKGFTVVLAEDMSDEDAKGIGDAISHIKGILRVDPEPEDSSDWIIRTRLKSELYGKIYAAINGF